MPEFSQQTLPGASMVAPIMITAGETNAPLDSANGSYSLNQAMQPMHFWSGDGCIDIAVDTNSGAIDFRIDKSALPAPVSAITAMRGVFTEDTNLLTLEIDYTDDNGQSSTIQLQTAIDLSDLQGPWNKQSDGTPAQNGDVDIAYDEGKVRLGKYGDGTYDDANPTRLAAFDADGNLVEFKDFCVVWTGTRAQLRSLRDASGLIPGCVYEVTDFSRGNLASSRIFIQAAARDKLFYDVALLTTHDNQPWHAIYDIDLHRVLMVRDNLRNVVESDEGNEVDNFPWGVASVYDNHLKNVNFTYTGGTFGDNTASDNASINMAGGDVRNNHFQNNVDFRINGTHQVYNSTFNRCRYYANDGSAGRTQYCDFSNDTYVEPGAITMERCVFGYADVRARGSVGRIDNSFFERGQVYVRNVPNLDIDDLHITGLGRVLGDNAARIRILRSRVNEYGYIQRAGGTPTIIVEYSHIHSLGYVRAYNTGTITVRYCDVSQVGRVDSNTTGSNRVERARISNSAFVRFWETVNNCLFDYSNCENNGYADFRGNTAGARIHRSVISDGRMTITNSGAVRIWYTSVQSVNSFIVANAVGAVQVYSCNFNAYGRMDLLGGRTGRVQGVSCEGTGYVRLQGGAGTLQHSSFDSYYYHYCTNQTGTHQGLQGSGRQTYTAPAGALTGAGQRNY